MSHEIQDLLGKGLTYKAMRELAYLLLLECEDVQLNSIQTSEEALALIQSVKKVVDEWEEICKKAIKIHEKYLKQVR